MFGLGKATSHKARINGEEIEVKRDETLLQAALRHDVDFPHICRVGGCGSCKCKVNKGEVQELTESAYLLTEKEIDDGYVLACQSRLKSDIEVELNKAAVLTGAPIKGEIIGREFLTHDIARIDVQLERPIDYKAGQYAEVTLDGAPDAPRSYSFATAPDDSGKVSFTIRRLPGGRFSSYVHRNDILGEKLHVRGPGGDFYVREGDKKILMIAGGSGLAPIMGMLQDMDRKGDHRPVTVLFGARQEKDLYEVARLRAYEAKWPNFRFVPVLSDDDYNAEWQGQTGLVTDLIAEEAVDAYEVYLCGPPAMIDTAVEELQKNGVDSDRIHADRFVVRDYVNTGFYGAVGLPEVERRPAVLGDYLKFMLIHGVGAGAVLSILGGGTIMWAGLLSLLGLYIVGDLLSPDDTSTPGYGEPWIMTVQLWLTLPMLSLIIFSFMWSLTTGDPLGFGAWVSSWSGYDIIAARDATEGWVKYGVGTVAAGFMIGVIGTVPAHELTHRTWDPISLWIGRWNLAFSYDVGFAIEHVYGHHRYVSTENDPATAPRGRNVYFHVVASTIKGNISAASIEADRLRRKHLPVFSFRNLYIRGLLMSVFVVALCFLVAGWTGVLFMTLAALWGKSLLEIVNYMEHYGMVRVASQPVQPRHSWNTNSMISSWGLFNLSRHSHHHAQGEVPYQELMPLPEAPQMINGYLATILVALCPPLWHWVMIPKLQAWDRDYASPEERVLALRANQRSGLRKLQGYDPRDFDQQNVAAAPAE